MPLTFDTHAFVKRLTTAGMPEPQAETVTAMVNEAREIDLANLATKADIQAVRTDFVRLEQATKADIQVVRSEVAQLAQSTKAEFQSVRSEVAQLAQSNKAEFQSVRSEVAQLAQSTKAEFQSVRSDMAQLEQRMTIKLGALIMAATGLLLAALRVMR